MTKTKHMTPDQVRATRPDASIWVGASAGTGKTHVLTARVLRLMVGGTSPEKILCLTFTKAGAAEMSNRVYKDLGSWITLNDEDLKETIFARTGEMADAKMLARARGLFGRVLDAPGGLKIQTIHSFCQSLLGRFPIEAGLTPRFKVMEDRTSNELMKSSREGAFTSAKNLADNKTLDAIKHIATQTAEQTFLDLMKTLTSERAHFRELLKTAGGALGLKQKTAIGLGLEANITREYYLSKALSNDSLDKGALLQLAKGLLEGTKSEKAKGEILADFLASDIKARVENSPEYLSLFLLKGGALRKDVANIGTLKKNPSLEYIITIERDRAISIGEKLGLIAVLENSSAMIQLAESILNNYDREKDRGGYLDYADLILKTDKLLNQAGIAPWVLFKLDGGVDHILVDEAQDTNPEQWRLIEALTNEFFMGLGARDLTRTLFAVGDAKQSIFSFQRADPAEFNRAQIRAHNMTQDAGLDYENITLNLSFRSTGAVLGAVDAIFSQDIANKGLTLSNENITHQTSREGDAGIVELWPYEPHEKGKTEGWISPIIQKRAQKPEARLALKIANKIEALIKGEEVLPSHGRKTSPGDIMVLVRRRKYIVDDLVRELKVRNIPVAGADRMMLLDQLAVMDLMALGKFACLPEDDLNCATLLKSPFIGLNDDDLFTLAATREKGTSVWASLKEKQSFKPEYKDAYEFLSDILNLADFSPPYEFFENVLVKKGGRQALVKRLGVEAHDPIDEFLSLSLGFEADHTPNLQGFLQWVGASEDDIKRDMEAAGDQVRIMTIHGSKGLQAPIVFLPDTCQTPNDKTKLLKIPFEGTKSEELLIWSGGAENETGIVREAHDTIKLKADQEYRRLLYVALTRAEDRLYIGGWVTSRNMAPGSWYDLIREGLKSHPDTLEYLDQNGETGLRLKTLQTAPLRIPDSERVGPVKHTPLGSWSKNKPSEELTPPRPLAPSRIENDIPGESPLISKLYKDPMIRGTLIHNLLELLPDIEDSKKQGATFGYLEKHELGQEANQIWNQINTILKDKKLGPLFGPSSRAEVPIAGVIGKVAFTAFIDRLLILEDEIWIIDYKTNRTPPPDIEQIPSQYLKQMAFYKKALIEVFGSKKIRTVLLWTEGAKWMEIPDIALEKYEPQ